MASTVSLRRFVATIRDDGDMSWNVLAPTLGGVVAALVGGTLGGWLGHRSQSVQWGRNMRMNAYADFIRSYAEVYSKLSRPWTEAGRSKFDWSEWNRSLAVVLMIAHEPVAAQAVKVEEAMWRMTLAAGRGPLAVEDWRDLRQPLEEAVLGFINMARMELGRLGPPMSRFTGRPDNADLVWTPPYTVPRDQPEATP